MAQTLSLATASPTAKLRAIHAIAATFEKWSPRQTLLVNELNQVCGGDHVAYRLAKEALDTFAREVDEAYPDWRAYENDGAWPREPVPGLGLQVIKVLSRPAV